jgi:hypothetical protein
MVMTQQEYEQKKRECFVKFCKDNGIDQEVNISIFDAFDQIFDRAFALGKQFGNPEQVDAEGEEILTVSRKRVREMYAANERIKADSPDKETAHISDHINHVLKHLFGTKCLPDEEQIAENANCSNVDSLSQNPPENCNSENHISTDDSKPAEPTDFGREVNFPTKNNPTIYLKKSKNCDNRLQIAAVAMQGILSNIDLFKNALETGTEILSGDGISYRAVAKASLLFADALIAEERS